MASTTMNGTNTIPESWSVDIPIGYTFRTRVSVVTGGTVIVSGKAVI